MNVDWDFWVVLIGGGMLGVIATLGVQWVLRTYGDDDDFDPWLEDARKAFGMPIVTSEAVPKDVMYVINPETMLRLPHDEFNWLQEKGQEHPWGDDALLRMYAQAKLRHPAYKITDIGGGS